jgi:hypothetical protein
MPSSRHRFAGYQRAWVAAAIKAVVAREHHLPSSRGAHRHHPRKRVIQYSRALVLITNALEYWVVRSSRTMTLVDVATACLRQSRLQIVL